MLGSSEFLILLLAVAVLFVVPRLQRRLEERVDEDKLGREALAAIAQRHTVRRLKDGEAPAILARFRGARALRVRHYTAHVTDEPGVNAVALPGGAVLLTAGLLALRTKGAMSEDELAGVLAHEVGHIELGHSRRGRVRETLSSWALRLGPTPGGPLARAAVGVGLTALQRRASRDAEHEADAWAQDLLRDAGFEPAALERFLERVAQWSGGGGLWSTHPAPAVRIEALRAKRSA